MEIRPARLEDMDAIIEVCSLAWLETYEDLHSRDYIDQVIQEYYGPDRLEKDLTDLSDAWLGYWVAVKNDRVIGCIGGGLDQDNQAHIYVFYVHPDYKRQGIGSSLLQAYTKYQKDLAKSHYQYISSLTEGNKIGQAFYEKMGFVPISVSEPNTPANQRRSIQLRREI